MDKLERVHERLINLSNTLNAIENVGFEMFEMYANTEYDITKCNISIISSTLARLLRLDIAECTELINSAMDEYYEAMHSVEIVEGGTEDE